LTLNDIYAVGFLPWEHSATITGEAFLITKSTSVGLCHLTTRKHVNSASYIHAHRLNT